VFRRGAARLGDLSRFSTDSRAFWMLQVSVSPANSPPSFMDRANARVGLIMLLRSLFRTALIGAGVLIGMSATSSAQKSAASVASLAWRLEAVAALDSTGATMRWPSLTAKGDTVAFAADLFPRDEAAASQEPNSVVFRLPGGRVPTPRGYGLGYPKAVYDHAGTLHIFWAEFAEGHASPRFWATPVRAIWHSALSRGGWSSPDCVARGMMIDWEQEGSAQIAVDATNGLHVLASVLDSASGYVLAEYRLGSAGWTRRLVAPAATYPAILALPDTSLVAVFAAASTRDAGPRILMSRLRKPGGRWDAPSALGGGEAAEIRSIRLIAEARTLSALWLERRAHGADTARLVRFDSDDRGATWHERSQLALPGMPARLSVFHTPCLGVTAMMELRSVEDGRPGSRVVEAQWRGGGRVDVSPAFPGMSLAMEVGAVETRRGNTALFVGADAAGNVANRVARRTTCTTLDPQPKEAP
jgi:hypothetical protein